MTGTLESLAANIGSIVKTGAIRRKIFQTIIPVLLMLPRRNNFRQMSLWSGCNENTLHNWYKRDLDMVSFNRDLIGEHGTGDYITVFDPSYLPKSGKKTPGLGYWWSGQAQSQKRGIELGCFAVADIGHHTAFHLSASLTPTAEELKKSDMNLMSHYVSLVKKNKAEIEHFGSYLVCDGYFGVSTFVNPVAEMGVNLISCLKINMAIHYLPEEKKPGRRGRPAVKGKKINWDEVDNDKLPLVYEDEEKRVRSSEVWVKCLGRRVLLVAVEYLREDGTMLCRKLYFCTSAVKDWQWVLERYGIRFQIEFLFRDAKQFVGLTHCQSTSKTKLENHANLALTALSVAKATHWLPVDKEQRGSFSVSELKTYYYNLMLLERFSIALGIDHNRIKNNPEIIKLLFSNHYAAWAA